MVWKSNYRTTQLVAAGKGSCNVQQTYYTNMFIILTDFPNGNGTNKFRYTEGVCFFSCLIKHVQQIDCVVLLAQLFSAPCSCNVLMGFIRLLCSSITVSLHSTTSKTCYFQGTCSLVYMGKYFM